MEKILIIHRGALGDLILALPALDTIKYNHQNANFTFMGKPSIIKLIITELCDKSLQKAFPHPILPVFNTSALVGDSKLSQNHSTYPLAKYRLRSCFQNVCLYQTEKYISRQYRYKNISHKCLLQ